MSNAKQLPHNNEEWKGYTLEEIRYARAYTAARMELNRERLTARARDMQKTGSNQACRKECSAKCSVRSVTSTSRYSHGESGANYSE